jgi:hypothetical protein
MAIYTLVLAAFVFGQSLRGATVTVQVTDSVGADRLDKILIIVRSLEGKGETTRGLTGADGAFPITNVAPGVYQALALYPYGYWHSAVREFVVTDKDILVEFRLRGSTVDRVEIPEVQFTVRVVDQGGNGVQGAQIIGRDITATFMKFSKTDGQGRATVSIPCAEAQISIIYNGGVVVRDIKLVVQKEAAIRDANCRIEGASSNAQETNIVVQLPTPGGPDVKH